MEAAGPSVRRVAGMAFGGIESRPFGLRFAHARRDRVGMESASDKRLDRFAELPATLVVAPVLPAAEFRVAPFRFGDAALQRGRPVAIVRLAQ